VLASNKEYGNAIHISGIVQLPISYVIVKDNVFVCNSHDSEIWENGTATGIQSYEFTNINKFIKKCYKRAYFHGSRSI